MSVYFRNAGWIFIEKFIRIIVVFILFALISRVLGPTDFGNLSFYQTTATMLLCVSSLGFDTILINKFNTEKQKTNEIFSTAFFARIIVSVTIIILFLIAMLFIDMPIKNKVVFIICVVSLLFQTQNTYFSFYQASLKSSTVTKLSLVSLVLSSAIKIYLLLTSRDILWFAISYLLDFVISYAIIQLYSEKKKIIKIRIKYFNANVLMDLLKASWPIIASSILVVLYTRLDQFMIMKMLGPESLGVFTVAVRISEAYLFIPVALATSYYPLISKAPTKENIRFYFDIILCSAVIMAIGVLIFSYFLIPQMFGNDYIDAFNILSVLVCSTTFAVFGVGCTNLMIVYNLSYMRLIRSIIGLIINFSLNIIFIPKFGIMGAAYSSLFCQIFSSWLCNAVNKKTKECFVLQTKSILTLGIYGGWRMFKYSFSKDNDTLS